MLRANLVPRSDNAALQAARKRSLPCWCECQSQRDVLLCVDGIDGLVLDAFPISLADRQANSSVTITSTSSLMFSWMYFASVPGLSICRMEETKIAATLTNTNDDLFVAVSVPGSLTATFLHRRHRFRPSRQYRPASAARLRHSSTDAMTEIPCGLIGTFVLAPERALELIGAHALPGFTEQQRGEEPDVKRKMRVVEDRPAVTVNWYSQRNTLIASIFFQCETSEYHGSAGTSRHQASEAAPTVRGIIIGRKQVAHCRESHGAPRKPKSPLQRLSTRKLVAAIRQDLNKKLVKALRTEKPKKGKDVA